MNSFHTVKSVQIFALLRVSVSLGIAFKRFVSQLNITIGNRKKLRLLKRENSNVFDCAKCVEQQNAKRVL
jgi:hypothetical protein